MNQRPVRIAAVVSLGSAAIAFGVALSVPGPAVLRAQQEERPPTPTCNEQEPQDFLIRGNYIWRGARTQEERQARHETHQEAIAYRTKQYGHFAPFGDASLNSHPPRHYARQVTVFGLPVRLNERIIPAVQCAEAEVRRSCSSTPYTPVRLSGLREENTFRGGEVSNHVFGIALDIDPHRNTCCGCVAKWRAHPLCQRDVDSVYERMAMPECWVRAFEKYGFYWLGHDTLQDTMHFEFLADPDRIVATP